MRYLAGLNEFLHGYYAHLRAEAGRSRPQRRKATQPTRIELALEFGQKLPVQHYWECLVEAVDRSGSNGVAGAERVVPQIRNQRGGQQRQIDGQEDCKTRGSGCERRANSS